MKKLFAIRDRNNNALLTTFFSEKASAKKQRNELNAELDKPRYVVTYGPDHRKANGR